MPVTRSALASRARVARQRRAGADQRRDLLAPAAPGAAPARPGEPSLAWKVTWSSSGTRDSSRALRSRSQKCRASAKRARSTRSLPAIEAAPPSSGSILATKPKYGAAEPSGVAEREIALVHPHRDLHAPRAAGPCRHRRSGRAAAPAIRPVRRPRPAGPDRPPPSSLPRRPSAAMPSAMTRLRSSASTSTRRSRSFSRPVARRR